MLAGLRGPNDFIGVQYLLDPTQHHGVGGRAGGRGAVQLSAEGGTAHDGKA